MNRERLQRLADYLRTVPHEQFDLRVWAFSGADGQHSCGSPACAIGHACQLFQAEGLRLRSLYGDDAFFMPSFDGSDGFEAAGKFFGIGNHDARDLFDDSRRYPASVRTREITPQMVADVIEQYMAE